MNRASFLPIGVCALPPAVRNAPHASSANDYIHEILGHAGLAYSRLTLDEITGWIAAGRLLVTVGETAFDESLRGELAKWTENGGAWFSIGGLCGAGDLFGADPLKPAYVNATFNPPLRNLGEGYLIPTTHRLLQHLEIPLHFFNGLAVTARDSAAVLARALDAHGRPRPEPILIEHGRCLLLAADAVGTVVHVQLGRAITRDGIPCPDGSGPTSDGVLKSDDGMVVDWEFDRQPVPGVEGLYGFLQPIADCWHEIILRAIFYLAEISETPVALLWYYPRNLPAIAHLSHDSDMNDPGYARHLLGLLNDIGIHSTWCIIAPGYEPSIINGIRDAGHELAMHYDALDHPWGYEEFLRQWTFLVRQFGQTPVANKNHYTRWEGDCEMYQWCARHGIEIDQSKGVSKVGSVGYNFGTCHAYFPVDPSAQKIDVLVMTTVCQDLVAFAPPAAGEALLARTLKHHGLFHMLFHPGHTHRADVDSALRHIVKLARDAGLEWWTARQINQWERARRQVTWARNASDPGDITFRAEANLPGATLLFANFGAAPVVAGESIFDATKVNRWGTEFDVVELNVEAETEYVSWNLARCRHLS